MTARKKVQPKTPPAHVAKIIESSERTALVERLTEPQELKTCKQVVQMLQDSLNAYRLGLVSKEYSTTMSYGGGVILQAIRMAREEQDPAGMLPEHLKTGRLNITADRSDMIAILTAGSSSVQVRMLRQKESQGQIINVTSSDVEDDPEEMVAKESIKYKAQELINMGKVQMGLFADD